MRRGYAAAGRAAGLCGLELLAVRDTAADIVYDLSERRTHRDLDQSGMIYLAAQCKHLCAFGFLGTHRGKPFRTVKYYLSHVGKGLDIVYYRRLPEQAFDRRERRSRTRFAALAFY